jgi:DNA-directed RNA polymerase specialized sigma24 family protein
MEIVDLERFAFGVARHVMQEHWREVKKRSQREATLTEGIEELAKSLSSADDMGIVSRKSLLKALGACLDLMGGSDRYIAQRCYGEGKSKENREALAVELHLTRNAIDARISRIRARLESCVRSRLAENTAGGSRNSD